MPGPLPRSNVPKMFEKHFRTLKKMFSRDVWVFFTGCFTLPSWNPKYFLADVLGCFRLVTLRWLPTCPNVLFSTSRCSYGSASCLLILLYNCGSLRWNTQYAVVSRSVSTEVPGSPILSHACILSHAGRGRPHMC